MSSAVEICSLVLLIMGMILCICTIFLPYWKINDPEDTFRDNLYRHEGLWLQCNSFATGNWECDDFNRTILGLPLYLQVVRALGVVSVLFAFFANVALLIGMESTPCAGDNKTLKRRIRLIAAVLAGLASLLLTGAVSWYANDIRIKHENESMLVMTNQVSNPNRYIFGASLFIGWAGGFLLIIGSLFTFCSACNSDDPYVDNRARYVYKPPIKPAVVDNYV